MKLLEQANQRVIEINKLMGEVEGFEDIINAGREAEIAFADKGAGTTYITVLSPEKMQELKEIVMLGIMNERDNKTAELETLLGIRKPATINPEFEEATKGMFQSNKSEPDPVEEKLTKVLQEEAKKIEEPKYPEMTVELVKELYHDKGMTLDQVAKEFGTNRTALYKFVTKHNLRKPNKKDIEQRVINVPDNLKAKSSVTDKAIKCRVCGKTITFAGRVNDDTWPYKYRRKRNGVEETVYGCSREHYLMGKAKDA